MSGHTNGTRRHPIHKATSWIVTVGEAGGEATGLPFRGAVTYKNPLPLKLATANEKKKVKLFF